MNKTEIKQFKQESDFNQFGIWFNDKRHQLGVKAKRDFIVIDYQDVNMWSIGNSFKRTKSSTFKDVLLGQIFLGDFGAILGMMGAQNYQEDYYRNPTISLLLHGQDRGFDIPTGLGTFKRVSFRGYLFQSVTREIKQRLDKVVEYHEYN